MLQDCPVKFMERLPCVSVLTALLMLLLHTWVSSDQSLPKSHSRKCHYCWGCVHDLIKLRAETSIDRFSTDVGSVKSRCQWRCCVTDSVLFRKWNQNDLQLSRPRFRNSAELSAAPKRRLLENRTAFSNDLVLWKITDLFRDLPNLIDLLLLVLHDRVGIWPPPQRAPASAVVRPDRPARHEPEEWGRGGASPHCRLGFRWVICPFHENHDLRSVCLCRTIPRESRGQATKAALCPRLGAISLFH